MNILFNLNFFIKKIMNILLREFSNRIAEKIKNILTEKKKVKKWIPSGSMKKGALSRDLGYKEEENIPIGVLMKVKKELEQKAKGSAVLSKAENTRLRRVNLALFLKRSKKKSKKNKGAISRSRLFR